MGYSAGQPDTVQLQGRGNAELVFAWNGVDTSQFEAVQHIYTAGSGSRVATLSVATGGSDYGSYPNILSLQGDATTAGNASIGLFLAQDPLPTIDNRRQYLFDVESAFCDLTGAAQGGFGLFLMGDDGGANLVGYSMVMNRQLALRVESGNMQVGTDRSTGEVPVNAAFRLRLQGRAGTGSDPNGNYPHFQMVHDSRDTGNPAINGGVWRNTFGSNDGDWGMIAPAVPPAVWNDTAANRWGVFLLGAAGQRYPNFWNINDIRVYAF